MYNVGTVKVSLNHTLPILLYYSTHKVFISHVKSSQADFNYELPLAISHRKLKLASEFTSLTRILHRPHGEHRLYWWRHRIEITASSIVAWRHREENTGSSIAACRTVFTELLPGNAIKSVTVWMKKADHGDCFAKAWTVFALSNSGIMGSNPTRGMDVCLSLFRVCVVLCIGRGLATGRSPVQKVLPTVHRLRNWKSAKVHKVCRAIDR
jgi:hypothetical protein